MPPERGPFFARAPPERGPLFCVSRHSRATGQPVNSTIKIASWNINSVRARAALIERLIADEQPDILCLQETKALNEVFPADLFR